MFANIFKKPAGQGTSPELDVKDFQHGQLGVGLAQEAGHRQPFGHAQDAPRGHYRRQWINVESGLDEKLVYWAQIEGPGDLTAKLISLFPPVALPSTVFEEKRGEVRANKVLGIMSRDIAGFKTVCHDVSSQVGSHCFRTRRYPPDDRSSFASTSTIIGSSPLELVGDISLVPRQRPQGFLGGGLSSPRSAKNSRPSWTSSWKRRATWSME